MVPSKGAFILNMFGEMYRNSAVHFSGSVTINREANQTYGKKYRQVQVYQCLEEVQEVDLLFEYPSKLQAAGWHFTKSYQNLPDLVMFIYILITWKPEH